MYILELKVNHDSKFCQEHSWKNGNVAFLIFNSFQISEEFLKLEDKLKKTESLLESKVLVLNLSPFNMLLFLIIIIYKSILTHA